MTRADEIERAAEAVSQSVAKTFLSMQRYGGRDYRDDEHVYVSVGLLRAINAALSLPTEKPETTTLIKRLAWWHGRILSITNGGREISIIGLEAMTPDGHSLATDIIDAGILLSASPSQERGKVVALPTPRERLEAEMRRLVEEFGTDTIVLAAEELRERGDHLKEKP